MRKEKIEVLDKEDIPKSKIFNKIFIIIIILGIIGLLLVFIKDSQEKKLYSISKDITIDNAINDNIDSDLDCIFIYRDIEKALKDYFIRYGKDYTRV